MRLHPPPCLDANWGRYEQSRPGLPYFWFL